MCTLGCLVFMHSGSYWVCLTCHAICARMNFSSVWVSVPDQHLDGHIDFQERGGGWRSPQPKPHTLLFGKVGGAFPREWPYRGSICFVFFVAFVLFFVVFLMFFVVCGGFVVFVVVVFVVYLMFLRFLSKVSRLEGPQFGWQPVHLTGVNLNIARSSSASRVHLNLPFQVWCALVFCAGFYYLVQVNLLFLCVLHLAFSMSPPSNSHWFHPCLLHLSNVLLSKLRLLFPFFLHLQFLRLFK